MNLKNGISGFLVVLAVLLSAGTACADIDVNVFLPAGGVMTGVTYTGDLNGPLYMSTAKYTTFDINFIVRDMNGYPAQDINALIYLSVCKGVECDLNYLIADLNLADQGGKRYGNYDFNCIAFQGGVDGNFRDANQMCRYRWTLPGRTVLPDNNYMIDINVIVYKRLANGVLVNDFNNDRDWSDFNIMYDNSPPVCTITSPSTASASVQSSGITLAFSASDANSGGIKQYYVSDGGTAYFSNGTTTTKTWAFSEWLPAIHTFYVKARDYSDNNCTADTIIVTFEGAPGGTAACGDGSCGGGENAGTCPADCPASCGDRVCTHTESASNCPADCVTGCGNKMCEAGETCSSCASDCGSCPGEEKPSGGAPGEGTPPGGTPPGQKADPCAGINCNDNNPCTTDNCYNGACSSVAVANGTSCGYGKECRGGACTAVSAASAGEGAGAAGLDITTLGFMLVVVAVLFGAYWFFIAKK